MKLTRPLALFLATLLSHAAFAVPEVPSFEQRFEEVRDAIVGGNRVDQTLIVHYHRQDDDYQGWNLWSWSEGAEGQRFDFSGDPQIDSTLRTRGRTEYGYYAVLRIPHDVERQGLIVRKNNWEARDMDSDRFVELDDDGVTEVWLVAGNPAVFTEPGDVDLAVRVVGAFLDSSDAITFTTSAPLDDRTLASVSVQTLRASQEYRTGAAVLDDRRVPGGVVYRVPITPRVADEDVARLRLNIRSVGACTVYARDVLDEKRFTAPLTTLGNLYTPERTVFRTWSPVSEQAFVHFYRGPRGRSPNKVVQMKNIGNGVWEAIVEGDMEGRFYDYEYRSYAKLRSAADIYARAATYNSALSVVVDLDATNPEGWAQHEPPTIAHPTDEVIYEIHVRDVSIRDDSLDPITQGTYLGLINEGGLQTPLGPVTTGLGHFKELGVTALHLLPIQDFPSPRDEYNWGYWTTLFNVPESNYATNWRTPTLPIVELKKTIKGLHDAGLRVILDVVYNHTSSSFEHSHFDNTVPFYYFRTTVDGRLRNDAGVGNSIADERVMVSKYISDSLMYWANEYKVDGFRFDLIGTHHPDSVRSWVRRLREFRSDLTIYGEPWTGGGPTYFPKGAQRSMGIAVFNDHLRNAIRGDLDGDARGFATGPDGNTGEIKRGVMGAIDDFTDGPSETINYASAHDNLTLWDKITKVSPGASDETRRDMQKLAHAIVLTGQGTPFIHGGAEFCRTKNGNHNSYNAGDDDNAFDWPRKAEYLDVFEYTAGLIELRKAHPVFRMRTTGDIRRHLDWLNTKDRRVIAFELDGSAVGDEWSTVVVVYNGSDKQQAFALPFGDWNQVVNHVRAGVQTIGTVTDDTTLPPYSAAVFYK